MLQEGEAPVNLPPNETVVINNSSSLNPVNTTDSVAPTVDSQNDSKPLLNNVHIVPPKEPTNSQSVANNIRPTEKSPDEKEFPTEPPQPPVRAPPRRKKGKKPLFEPPKSDPDSAPASATDSPAILVNYKPDEDVSSEIKQGDSVAKPPAVDAVQNLLVTLVSTIPKRKKTKKHLFDPTYRIPSVDEDSKSSYQTFVEVNDEQFSSEEPDLIYPVYLKQHSINFDPKSRWKKIRQWQMPRIAIVGVIKCCLQPVKSNNQILNAIVSCLIIVISSVFLRRFEEPKWSFKIV